jgi:glycosyltransferase involved in cell wall biosynthesis
MIHLVAPDPAGRRSGGFLINNRLATVPWVVLHHATPEALAGVVGELRAWVDVRTAGNALVLDSLYLSFPRELADTLTPVCAGASPDLMLLTHSLPSLIPNAPVAQRRARLADEQALLPRFVGALSPSRFMAGALIRRGLPEERIRILSPPAVITHSDLDVADGDGAPVILTVANYSGAKGHEDLYHALLQLPHLQWQWWVAGCADGASHRFAYATFRHLVETGPAASRTRFLNPSSPTELAAAYHRAAVFALPSLMESYGLAFAEARVFGVPIVGYRVAAVPESAGDAALVPPGDVAGLAAGIAAALERYTGGRTHAPGASDTAATGEAWDRYRRDLPAAVAALSGVPA